MGQNVRIWTTDAVDHAKRFDYWVGAVCECFLEMEVDTTRPATFSAELKSTQLGDLRINRVSGSAQQVQRTARAIGRSQDNYYYLLRKEGAPCGISQHGAGSARLLAGDLALIDSRQRYQLDFPDIVDIVSIQLPIAWLDTWLPKATAHLGIRIDGNAGWGQVLSTYVRQMQAVPEALPAWVHCDHFGGLLALTFGATANDNGDATPLLLARIESCVRSRFAEPGLCASDIAEALGISVRTLHRALLRAQRTFTMLLMQHRMEAAHRMLMSPAYRRLTTAEIGRRVGLLDPSHFARLYRSWSGSAPHAARAQR